MEDKDSVSCDYDAHIKNFILEVLNLEHYEDWVKCCSDSYDVANKLNVKSKYGR
jgi:hypothetical protein